MLDPPNFPVIIGVTGHRDIAPGAEEPVRQSVRALLDHWRCQFGDALHVMTALADGADQLVADAAWAARVPIIAVAPLPLAVYRETLKNPGKLDEHWKHAALRLTLPEVRSDGRPDYHERQYEQLGVLLIRRSHLLLGLWDGTRDATARSGAGAVVRMRLEGDHDAAAFRGSPMFHGARSYLDETNRGPLLHVFTPRGGTAEPRAEEPAPVKVRAGACQLLGLPDSVPDSPPADANWEGTPVDPRDVLHTIRRGGIEDFDRINELNKKISSFHGSEALIFEQQLAYLTVKGIRGQASRPARILIRQQAGADTAAQTYQGPLLGHFVPAKSPCDMVANAFKVWRTTGQVPRLGAAFLFAAAVPLAVFFFELYTENRGRSIGVWAVLLYLLVFGGATGYYKFRVEPQEWQSHFQDYRALAEAMRVQLYWAFAGVPAAVSDHYLRKQSGELGWIQFALRGPSLWAAALARILDAPNREVVTRAWINDQARYFGDKRRLHHNADQRGQTWTTVLASCGIVVSTLLLLLEIVPIPDRLHETIHAYHAYIVVLAATLPALAAFFSLSRELRAYEPHAHSYALMRRMFNRAANEANKPNRSDQDFQDLVRELGREALAENAEWLEEHRHRKIEQHS